MIDAEKLGEMAAELSRQAITDIHENWSLVPKSQAALRDPVKFSMENTIKYNMAKLIVDIYQRAKKDAQANADLS